MDSDSKGMLIWTVVIVAIVVLGIVGLIWGYQTFRVYSAAQSGKAQLAEAEYNRQIIVRQAQAKLDASTLEAEAAVAHAKGVKESNDIISDSLGGPEGYLRFLYIQMLQDSDNKQVIYIPTEAGLPILEAGKR